MDEDLIQALWIEFLNKLEVDWNEKHKQFGDFYDFKNVKKTNLAKEILADMKKELRLKDRDIDMSWNTLYSYVRTKSFKGASSKTLLVIVKYLGYSDIKDFSSNSTAAQQLKSKERIIKLEKKSNLQTQSVATRKKYKPIVVASVLLGLVLGMIYYKSIQQLTLSEHDTTLIKDLLHKANNLEFNLYEKVPDLKDTVLLEEYHISNGAAKKTIIETLKRRVERNTILDIDNSMYKLSDRDIVIEPTSDHTATAKTLEYWKIIWLRKDSLKNNKFIQDRIWDNLNKQNYMLIKQDDKWFIEQNVYSGKSEYPSIQN